MPYQNESYMGSGDVFMQAYDDSGVLTGPKEQVGNADSYAINAPAIEKAERKGKMRQNWGQVIHSIIKSTEQSLSIVFTDFIRSVLAKIMMGTDTATSQTAGNDATPQDVIAVLGGWVDMGHMKLDPATPPVVQDETDTTTYVEDTDYEIDYQGGWLHALEGGAITDAETLHVVNTWLAYTGWKVTANTKTQVNVKIEMLTENKAGSALGKLTVHKVQLETSEDLAWLSEEYIDFGFGGNIITVDAGSWEYEQFD